MLRAQPGLKAALSTQSTPLALQAQFKTTPDTTKLEIREFLEKVYQVPVLRVDTAIVQGQLRLSTNPKQKRRQHVKESDFKRVWVTFAPGCLHPAGPNVARVPALEPARARRGARRTEAALTPDGGRTEAGLGPR